MGQREASTWILGPVVIALGMLAACGGSSVKSKNDSSGADECSEDATCDSFKVVCNSGTEMLVAGCRTDKGCRSKNDLPASVCDGEGFESVEVAVLDDEPSDSSDAGTHSDSSPIGGSTSCRDNVVIFTNPIGETPTSDCTLEHQVCQDDGHGHAECVSPSLGDECPEGTVACTADGTAAVCKDHAYTEVDFEIPCACDEYSATGGKNTLFCDSRDYSIEGTHCDVMNDKAASCSPDLTAIHECQDGQWTPSKHCGSGACERYDDGQSPFGVLRCSYGGLGLGDACTFSGDQVICSSDQKQLFNCVGGVTVVKQTCPDGQECRRAMKSDGSTFLHCAASGYVAGDPCHFPDGALVCSADQTMVLVCDGGMMKVDTMCESGSTCQPAVKDGVPIGACK